MTCCITDAMDHISGNLYLGCAEDVRDCDQHGVTHVLTVDISQPPYPNHVIHHQIAVTDEESSDILSHIPDALQFIESSLGEGGKVLVHCRFVF